MRRPWVAGNWKMNGLRETNALLAKGLSLLAAEREIDICVAPPAPYWLQVVGAMEGTGVRVLAQNVSEHAGGAHTGEHSVSMLQDCGLAGALVGHSERRQLHGETDVVVAEKFAAVRKAGLQPVLCVGETLDERRAGETLAVVSRQLLAVLESQGPDAFDGAVLAYEPVWAIGTGLTATPEQAQAVHAVLRADAVVVPVNPMNREDEFVHYLTDPQTRVVICSGELAGIGLILVGTVVIQLFSSSTGH